MEYLAIAGIAVAATAYAGLHWHIWKFRNLVSVVDGKADEAIDALKAVLDYRIKELESDIATMDAHVKDAGLHELSAATSGLIAKAEAVHAEVSGIASKLKVHMDAAIKAATATMERTRCSVCRRVVWDFTLLADDMTAICKDCESARQVRTPVSKGA